MWLRKLTPFAILAICSLGLFADSAYGQCADGCGAAVMGGMPASMLGDQFSAGDSFCGGPGGPMMPGADSGWGGGGGAAYQLGGACCGPHWYDFAVQSVFMLRDGGDSRGLMSRGIRGNAAANIVQSTDSTDFNFEAGLRVAGRFQTSALHSIEAIYLGGLDWDDRHIVTDDNHNLYSSFSDFGDDPFGGFEDSDQASISAIEYDSELDSFEINFRRALAPVSDKIHVSTLWGFRYIRIDESLSHRIDVLPHFDDVNMVSRDAEFTNYDIRVTNDMFGLQGGAESVICLTPGIQFGAEGKIGVYGNNADLNSSLTSSTLPSNLSEADRDGSVSFVSDANMFLLWQFHPMLKLRAGYEVLFVSRIGTAGSNYDTTARDPLTGNQILAASRIIDVDNNDSVLYHGLHVGFEFGW